MKKNSKLNLQQVREQLRKIDVAELLDKAKSVKIDDLKSFKLKDLDLNKFRSSPAFCPTIGIFLAGIITSLALIPNYKQLRYRQKLSSLYSQEASMLSSLVSNLENKDSLQLQIETNLYEYKDLLINNSELISITEILSSAAKKTSVEVIEFSPLSKEDLTSCSSSSEEDQFNTDFGTSQDPFQDEYQDDFQDDFQLDEPFDMDLSTPKATEIYEFNMARDKIDNLFSNIPQPPGDKFTSNYFVLQLSGDYINVIDFKNSLQDFKVFVIPYCFEPQVISSQFSSMSEGNSISNGIVEARLVINIPTKK